MMRRHHLKWLLPLLIVAVLINGSSARADQGRLLAADAAWSFAFDGAPRSIQASDGAVQWQFGALVAAGRGPGPLQALNEKDVKCTCTVVTTLVADQRLNHFWAWAPFDVPARPIGVLEIRARYRDAIAIAINGFEVASRNMPIADAAGLIPAEIPARLRHGPEWESFYVTVPPGFLHAGENRIAVELRAHASGRAPQLELEIWAWAGGSIVRGPMVQRVTTSTASIIVETSSIMAAMLRWRPKPPTRSAVTHVDWNQVPSAAAKRHVFVLSALPPGGVEYQVLAGGSVVGNEFFTAPLANRPLRLAVYGDVRGGHQVHQRIIESMLSDAPDAVLTTGDMVLRGSDEADWQRFFAVVAPLVARVAMYTAIGNHDLGFAGSEQRGVLSMFDLPTGPPAVSYYSFELAGVHLVFLDSNHYEDPAQLQWLEADLQTARSAAPRAILAITHAGPYSRGIHRGSAVARERYAPLLAKYNVDLLLSGHEHQYQRGEISGLRYVVTGGGGASLYPITCGSDTGKRCIVSDGMKAIAREHHYLMITVNDRSLELCPKRPDGTPLEPCSQLALHR
jgi:acid phosphatase type 7